MTREEALSVLGVESADQANEAFRAESKACHPNGPTPDLARWEQISEAKRVLLTPFRCEACKGQGRIYTRIASVCRTCGGKGWLS